MDGSALPMTLLELLAPPTPTWIVTRYRDGWQRDPVNVQPATLFSHKCRSFVSLFGWIGRLVILKLRERRKLSFAVKGHKLNRPIVPIHTAFDYAQRNPLRFLNRLRQAVVIIYLVLRWMMGANEIIDIAFAKCSIARAHQLLGRLCLLAAT